MNIRACLLYWDSVLSDNLKQTFFRLQSFLKENEQVGVLRYIFDVNTNEPQLSYTVLAMQVCKHMEQLFI